MRRIIVIMADMHSGSSLGLLTPNTVLIDDAGAPWVPNLGATQATFLWPSYETALLEVLSLADGDPITLIHNGDICQGDRHGPLISPLLADQVTIALANLEPWFTLGHIERLYLLNGTEAHDYSGGSAERMVGKALAERVDVRYCAHLLLDVGQQEIDIAHHGPHPGRRKWLEGNIARFYLRDRMLGEIGRGRTPPALYVRAHRHQPIDETLSMYGRTSRIMIVPSWQAAGQYVRAVAQSLPHICCGMAAVEVLDGRIAQVHKYVYEIDIRTEDGLDDG